MVLNSVTKNLTQPLVTKTSKMPVILLAFLSLFFLPVGLWNLYRALIDGFAVGSLLFAAVIFITFATATFLFLRGNRLMPRQFDREGVTRKDGKRFLWKELESVEHQYQIRNYLPNKKAVWRVEVRFMNGLVYLLPMRINNFSEIYQFVSRLPCRHKERFVKPIFINESFKRLKD